MQEQKQDKLKIKQLKQRLKRVTQQNRYLRQRKKELWSSRQNWKQKSKERLELLRLREKEIGMLKQQPTCRSTERVKGYQYSHLVMCLAIWLRTYCNNSLRSCVRTLEVLNKFLDLGQRIPCATTIYYWECKLGYYRLERAAPLWGPWSLILDESITIAQQRILLLIGCNLSSYQFGQALSFQDVRVLSIEVDKSWTELCVGQQIRRLQAKGYHFVNAISDGGKAIVKALKVLKIRRVADCTHTFANLLEKQYKKTATFQSFTKWTGQVRIQLMNGIYGYLIPPSLRTKSRFLNLFELSTWAKYVLTTLKSDLVKQLDDSIVTKLQAIKKLESFIEQIYQQCQTIKKLSRVLKTQGLCDQSQKQCLAILDQSEINPFFKQGVKAYFNQYLIQGQCQVCSSDVIESIFGKFKYRMSPNKMAGFGLSCLTIANMTRQPNAEEINLAMQQVRIHHLKQWAKDKLYPNRLQKKRQWIKTCKKKLS